LSSGPIQLKQKLLNILSAEIAVNAKVHGDITAFHSVFQDWNPLLPHETILTVLRTFGVFETWLGFFTTFLRAPLWFVGDEAAGVRTRLRGRPSSHALSNVFGETVLFCLDFAVNQAANGQFLWRVHDDIWFLSPDHSIALKTWNTVSEFMAVTGTSIN
jgi:hypothetical protein